jgi:hypothetical protein
LKNIVVGGRVRVKPRSFLEQFQRESKYKHLISNEQLEAAGMTDTVKGQESIKMAMRCWS